MEVASGMQRTPQAPPGIIEDASTPGDNVINLRNKIIKSLKSVNFRLFVILYLVKYIYVCYK